MKAITFYLITLKIQISKLDKKFSLLVRTLAGWICSRCGGNYRNRPKGLHASHFWGRAAKSVRFDLENVDAHCFGCHQFLGANPHEFREWKLKQLGEAKYKNLMLRANLPHKPDYKAIEMWVDQELKRIAS